MKMSKIVRVETESQIKARVQRFIENTARDATIGAGDASESVRYDVLNECMARRFERAPTTDEQRMFAHVWRRCLQEMAQP